MIWLFVAPDRLWPIALEAIVSGTLWGGHGIAAFDLSIGVSRGAGAVLPGRARDRRRAGFAVSSMLAGLLASALSSPLHVLGSSWSDMHVLFLLSAIARPAPRSSRSASTSPPRVACPSSPAPDGYRASINSVVAGGSRRRLTLNRRGRVHPASSATRTHVSTSRDRLCSSA